MRCISSMSQGFCVTISFRPLQSSEATISMISLDGSPIIQDNKPWFASELQQKNQMDRDLKNCYTVVPVEAEVNQLALDKYVHNQEHPLKASLCRFFLRGICIMKKEYCKFAHGMDDLIECEEQVPFGSLKDQQKREAISKSFFLQKPLFLCRLNYHNLYQYNRDSSTAELTLEEINKNVDIRNKLRVRFHKYQCQTFVEYVERKYPSAVITIPWITEKYVKYGFCKPHTHCKVQSFHFWLDTCNFYLKIETLLPPLVDTPISIIFKRYSKKPIDKYFYQEYLIQQEEIEARKPPLMDPDKRRQQLVSQYLQSNPVFAKQSICKFYMKGVCMFSEEECKFCHSLSSLTYIVRQSRITDPEFYQQKALMFQPRKSYISLFQFQRKLQTCEPGLNLTLLDLDRSSSARADIRQKLHRDIYCQFMSKLQQTYPSTPMTLSLVKREYYNCGLNKTKADKFPLFIQEIQALGFEVDSFVLPPSTQKRQFVFKRLDTEELDRQFSNQMVAIVRDKIEGAQLDNEQIVFTEGHVRKKFYQLQQFGALALHRYLKLTSLTLKQFIQAQISANGLVSPYLPFCSFDLKNNIEKIHEGIRLFYKLNNKFYCHYSRVEACLRASEEEAIVNYLTANGLRLEVMRQTLEMGKQLYLLPNGQVIIVSKNGKRQSQQGCVCKVIPRSRTCNYSQEFCQQDQVKYRDQRVVVVDDGETIRYSERILSQIDIVGVDLEGCLSSDGFIYLVQFGILHPHTLIKQTLVFDIWLLSKDQTLLKSACQVLKNTLESPDVIKVMHDCRNDSVALHLLLGICLYPVFDTAAMQSHFEQRAINKAEKDKEELIKLIFKTGNKSLGLNQVLEKYNRPVNKLKQQMKNKFQLSKGQRQAYFESRPLNPQFLEYAVRDVEQLIDTFRLASGLDSYSLWKTIGLAASTVGLKS